jgi:quinol monooxygenase YgiN
MFIAVYRFVVSRGKDEEFRQAWHERTKEIMSEFGGLGSRLHRDSGDNSFVAYAQWKSREHWLNSASTKDDTKARAAMRESTESAEKILELEVLDDLLVHFEHSQPSHDSP